MRKFFINILIVLLACVCVSPAFGCFKFVNATEVSSTVEIENKLKTNLTNFLSASLQDGYNRVAGSDGEYKCAVQLSQTLKGYLLQAKTHSQDASIMESQDGIQEFSYFDNMLYSKKLSHNVIYTIKGASSERKIVLCTNYDNLPYDYKNLNEDDEITNDTTFYCSQGINASASNVAVLLTLAQILPQNYYNFDIEIVFFGAGYQDNAGAKYYNQIMSKSDRDSAMLVMDVSRIGLGESLYYYQGEFEDKDIYKSTLKASKFQNSMHGASVSDDSLLGYTSAGYSSSTQVFEGCGLNVLHLFAGAYHSKAFGGFCEYNDKTNVTNTKEDNLDYIYSTYGTDLLNNMAVATTSIKALVDEPNFVKEFSEKPSTWQYNMLEVNIMVVVVVILFVLIITALLIHYVLETRAYKYSQENRINGIMIQIDEPTDDNSKDKR